MSNSNSIGVETFNTAFPLDFVLQNQYQGADLSVLYIVDNVDDKDNSQQIKVVITTTNKEEKCDLQGFQFTPPATPTIPANGSSSALLVPSNAPITPSETQYNLAIAVRPGTLRSAVQESFSISLYNSITAALGAGNSCVVNGPIARKSDGALVWYVAFENDIKTGWNSVKNWTAVPNSINVPGNTDSIKSICVLSDGSVLGMSSTNDYYIQDDISKGIWKSYPSTSKGPSVALRPNGDYISVGTGFNCWKVPAPPSSAGEMITGSSSYADVFVLPDDSIVGINTTDSYLYHFKWTTEMQGSWGSKPVDSTKKIAQVAALPNGQILAIGQADGYLYKKQSWNTGSWELLDDTVPLQAIGVKSDGSLLLYGTDNKMYVQESSTAFSFMLEGISAAAGTGTRSSQVEMRFGNVSVNESANLMSFKRSVHLDIINHEGHSYAPLYFGVLGDGTLLNKEGTLNDLSIYFETTNGKPIQLAPDESPTKIDFSFPCSPDDGVTELMAFGNKSEVASYALNQSGKYPLDTSGVASDDGEGFYKISGEFKNLASIQEVNTPSAENAITESQKFYGLPKKPIPVGNKDAWLSAINTYNENSATLASFITEEGGPLQNKWNTTYKTDAANALVTYYYDPTGANTIAFDAIRWIQQYKKYMNSAGNNGPSSDNSSWDKIPSTIIPLSSYDYANPWKDIKFTLYVMTNFSFLVSLLESANSEAVFTAASVKVNGTSVTPKGIVPCRAVFEFFRLYYDLQNTLLTTPIVQEEVLPIGPQELANRFTRVYKHQQEMANIESLTTLGKFIVAPNGPIVSLVQDGPWDDELSDKSINSVITSFVDGSFGFITLGTGQASGSYQYNYAPFSLSDWQGSDAANYTTLDVSNNNTSWDVLPPEINLNVDWSSPWGNGAGNAFYQYVNSHWNELACQLHSVMNIIAETTLTTDMLHTPIIACKAITAFFYTQYSLQAQLDASISAYLLSTKAKITASSWNKAFGTAIQKLPSGNSILTESHIHNNSQIWDDKLIAYLKEAPSEPINGAKTNLEQLAQIFTPITLNDIDYLVPAQSLYDYVKSKYDKDHSVPRNDNSTSLYQPTSYVFNFNQIQISGIDGLVTLDISIKNLPGYWDTTFQIPIRKSSSILDPTLKLGHSGSHGRIEILPTDSNYSGNNGLTPGSRIDFLSGGKLINSKKHAVSIEEYYGINLIGTQAESGTVNPAKEIDNTTLFNKTGQPVRVMDADLLVTDGRIGVGNVPKGYLSGNFSNAMGADSHEKLRVEGNTYVNGQITATTDLIAGGNVNTQGNLTVGGNLNIQGELQFNGTPHVPVGTIAQIITSSDSPVIPDGWLACDGSDLLNKYIIQSKTTPNAGGNGSTTTYSLHHEYFKLFLYLADGMTVSYSNDDGGDMTIDKHTVINSYNSPDQFYFYNTKSKKVGTHDIVTKYQFTLPKISSKSMNKANQPTFSGTDYGNQSTLTTLTTIIKY